MPHYRINFEMECLFDGHKCCKRGLKKRAFALMEAERTPQLNEALAYVETSLYYCSIEAEKHFLDSGNHNIRILEIALAG